MPDFGHRLPQQIAQRRLVEHLARHHIAIRKYVGGLPWILLARMNGGAGGQLSRIGNRHGAQPWLAGGHGVVADVESNFRMSAAGILYYAGNPPLKLRAVQALRIQFHWKLNGDLIPPQHWEDRDVAQPELLRQAGHSGEFAEVPVHRHKRQVDPRRLGCCPA